MAFAENTTITKIKSHIEKRGGAFKSWFVGIGQHAGRELKRHGVRRKGNCWIFVHADSSTVAENVRSHFVEALGLLTQDGQRGDYVYAYRLSMNTKP